MIVLFTESNIGIHNPDNEEYEVLKYVFIPSITRRKDKFIPEITPKSPRIAELLGEYKKKTSDFSFLMGYDLDENGELMSQALITPFEKSHWSLADGMNRIANPDLLYSSVSYTCDIFLKWTFGFLYLRALLFSYKSINILKLMDTYCYIVHLIIRWHS